jgi:hypothetical protein
MIANKGDSTEDGEEVIFDSSDVVIVNWDGPWDTTIRPPSPNVPRWDREAPELKLPPAKDPPISPGPAQEK